MLKNNNKRPSTGYDRIEFYIDFVQVLLSAFMLGYVVGKKKKERIPKTFGKNLHNIRRYGIVYTTQERYLMLHPAGLAGCGLYIFRTLGVRPGILSLFVWKAPS